MTIRVADTSIPSARCFRWRLLGRPAAVFGFLCGAVFFGCGDAAPWEASHGRDTDTARPAFVIHVTDSLHATLPRFVAVVRHRDTSEELECPGGVGTDVSCSSDQISLQEMPRSLVVTVKSPGYRFVSQSWSSQELFSMTEATISLSPLEPFESNDDYATGFSPQGSPEDFCAFSTETSGNLGAEHVVKFYMEGIDGAPEVYFMNTSAHFLHYQFVRDVLGKQLTEIDYQQQTYVDPERTAMAGTLIYYPDATVPLRDGEDTAVSPVIMTFFPSDRLTPEHAATAHRLIEERLGFLSLSGDSQRLFYLPPGELQLDALMDQASDFADAGIPWMRKSDLYANTTLQILNEGEAYGTLHRLVAETLETAVFSFRDILILATLPNDLPLSGGTITEQFQTPLSHVNVAAMNRGTPNIALPGAGDRAEIAALIGTPVHFLVRDGTFILEAATAEEAEAFWAQRSPPEVSVEADTDFSEIQNLEDIVFADSVRFGAKAANVAELSRLLGDSAPHGFAVPFYFYDQFAATAVVTAADCLAARLDCVEEGRAAALCETAEEICEQAADSSLQQYIEALLALDSFSMDALVREALLDGIRHHYRNLPVDPGFAGALDEKVWEMLGSQKVRLRSSTNAEDLTEFSGAGLYESVSAYGDVPGDLPSEEIRKVWASAWSFRAFEERSFWNVNQLSVHMGVLVHQAFPDEAANGVLITRNLAEPTVEGFYVNVQAGETSVTNPELGSPEIFSIIPGAAPGYIQSAVYAYSSLTSGQRILTDEEVRSLYEAAVAAQEHFGALYGISYWELAVFEMEFKFHGPSRQLIVKQIRPFYDGG